MDPFAALGLAGNIVQFIDFAWTLFSETQRISSSADGLTAENRVLEVIVHDVHNITRRITPPPGPGSDQVLQKLCEECNVIAIEIQEALRTLRSGGQQRQWKSFMAALKQLWKKDRIDRLSNRLARAQAQVTSHIQLIIMNDTSSLSKAIQELRDTNTYLHIETRQDLADLQERVNCTSKALLGERRSSGGMMQGCLEMLQRQQTLQTRTAERIALQLQSLSDLKDPNMEIPVQEFLGKMEAYVDVMRQPPDAAIGLAQEMSASLERFSRSVKFSQERKEDSVASPVITWIANTEKIVETLRLTEMQQQQAVKQMSDQLQELSQSIQSLEQASHVVSSHQAFLRRIYFPEIKSRHRKIETAHSQTFEWILQSPAERGGQSLHSFVKWLRYESRPFWIRGKAGSGKSTLMKFIADHSHTKEHLEAWAAGKRLVTAQFYFWNAGSALQKSQEGLFRGLLFEILRLCPGLIPSAEAVTQRKGWFKDEDGPWALEDLLAIYKALLNEDIETKFCFFIDGLDEFQDFGQTHMDLIKTLRDLENSPNIKLCLSSRPWIVFKDEFGDDADRSLKLEDLTRGDMRQVVQDKFTSHRQFPKLRESDREYESLVDQVVDRSQGVFLWVHLVLRELLEGLTYNDSVQDLRQRLERFPEDLDSFFRQMLDSIPKFYRPRAARMLKIATEVEKPLPLVFYWFLEEVEEHPKIAIDSTAQKILTIEEIDHRLETVRRRLDGHSRGLLEVVKNRYPPDGSGFERFKDEVTFLHRTVRDFLIESGTDFLHQEGDQGDADALLLPCKAVLAAIKKLRFEPSHLRVSSLKENLVTEPIRIFFFFGAKAADRPGTIDDLRRFADETEAAFEELGLAGSRWEFLELACQQNALFYLEWKLARVRSWWTPRPLNDPQCHALHYALSRAKPSMASTVDILLRYGADPNQRLTNGNTAWTDFLDIFEKRRYQAELDKDFEILRLLIRGGADLDAIMSGRLKRIPTRRNYIVAREVLEHTLAAEQFAILLASQPGWLRWAMKRFRAKGGNAS